MQPDSDDKWDLDPEAKRFLDDKLSSPVRFIRALEDEAKGETMNLDSVPQGTPQAESDTNLHLSPERYTYEAEIASGGSGRVLHVYDKDMHRLVAMKVLREDRRDPQATERFLEEAKATGQLEHPNIPPVYDLGLHPEYGTFFTMRLVRGRTLQEILRDLSIGRLETLQRFTLTRLVQILEQVAMGIHYAHVRGVIHRDLKPANIMVGDFGEVLVLDWGIARVAERKPDSSVYQDPIQKNRDEDKRREKEGSIAGSLPYMSPEQARGWVDQIDERTDIFGLGAVLYEILTFHPPYDGTSIPEVLARAGACEIALPHVRAPRNSIPPSLEEICMKALSAKKDARHTNAMTFHEDLQVFLDGTLEADRRREEADHLVRQATELARSYQQLSDEESSLRADAKTQLEALAAHDPMDLKARAWDLLDQAAKKNRTRVQVFSDATALLHSAINIDETSADAKEALADLYWQRFEEAERAGNQEETAIYRRLVERYHQGKFAALLEDKGLLTVVTNPPGTLVFLHRIVEREWRLVEEDGKCCGTTPVKLELPTGDFLLVLKKEGFRDTRYPVHVKRCDTALARVNLYSDGDIGEGFLYIPQGETIVGGDPEAPGSLPLGRRFVGDVFMARFPVTFREYCAFLDDLRADGDAELEPCIPRTEKEGACVRLGADNRFVPSTMALDIEPTTREHHPDGPDAFEWALPVLAVSWHAAKRYTRWLSDRSGRRVRLLRDAEWEKAARGVAGWIHPWGDRFDWSLLKGGLSRPGRAQPEPVGTFPTDRSIYGVRDLAGSIREWCEDWFLENKYRLTRGGSWFSIHEGGFRAAHRLGTHPDRSSSVIGFRVAVHPPPPRPSTTDSADEQ